MSSSSLLETEPREALSAIEFGPFRYDPVRREISDAQRQVRIGSRALQILEVLLEQPGRLFSRDELVARVWPRTVVEETSLRVHVSALRKVLRDGQDGARYITNVPGRGYAFIGELRASPHRGVGALASPPPLGAGPANGAAVPPPLPARLTRAIGREQVIAQIGELLGRERLVSIVGAGGMGKTTVALAVADRLRGDYTHGAYLVDLSRLSDPALVAAEIGQTQGLIVLPGDPLAALDAVLRDKELLFVIDNCEQVIDAVAGLIDRLMRVCPGLHFLTTSREPLEVEAEWVFKLPPLALPEPGDELDTDDLLAYPAIQLFVERAQAISDSFELTGLHAPAVRQLCTFLDGIPLAIELAAARVDSLGVQGLLRRLESAFELLTRGRRTALSRHRTLQAVLDWSYDLLSDSERLVLERLSVLRGSFDLDGAAMVACCDQLPRQRVIEDVLALCAKSLVVMDRADEGVAQHRLLYITRLYAEKRLAARAEAPEVHRRHAIFVLDGVRKSKQMILSRYHWTPELCSSIADIRAALDWSVVEENDLVLGFELTAAANRTFADAGIPEEYWKHIETAMSKLARLGAARPRLELQLRVAAACTLGYMVDGGQRYDTLFSHIRQLESDEGSDEDRIEALYGISIGGYGQGDYHQVLAWCEEIRTMANGKLEPLRIALSDRLCALCLHAIGQHEAAERLAWRVIAFNGPGLSRKFFSEVPFGVSMRIQLARIEWLRGNFSAAGRMLTEVLEQSVNAHVFARCQLLAMAAIPLAIWRGDMALADQWTKELGEISVRSLGYWQGFAQAFRCIVDGTAISPGSAMEHAMRHCAPLGDMMATLRPVSPIPSTQARVEAAAVGWCAPEVMRLVALDELSHAPAAALARLEQAMLLAQTQGARFWMLRIALTSATVTAACGGAPAAPLALKSLSELLFLIDDGSPIPELVTARALLKGDK